MYTQGIFSGFAGAYDILLVLLRAHSNIAAPYPWVPAFAGTTIKARNGVGVDERWPHLAVSVGIIRQWTTAPDQWLARLGIDDAFQMGRIVRIGSGLFNLRLGQAFRWELPVKGKFGTFEDCHIEGRSVEIRIV